MPLIKEIIVAAIILGAFFGLVQLHFSVENIVAKAITVILGLSIFIYFVRKANEPTSRTGFRIAGAIFLVLWLLSKILR